MNGISSLLKHLESIHHKLWGEWCAGEGRTGVWVATFQKEVQPHPKDDSIQKEFEEDLTLFIAKELVSLSFVEAPFFKKLILNRNPHLNFPLRWILVMTSCLGWLNYPRTSMCLHPLSLVILASFLLIYGCVEPEWIPLSWLCIFWMFNGCHVT